MDIRNLPDAVANVMLGVAHELDETAIDHDLVHGATVTGLAIRFVSTGLVVGAMPLVFLDFVTGGLQRRTERYMSAEEPPVAFDSSSSPDANPAWWVRLPKDSRPEGR